MAAVEPTVNLKRGWHGAAASYGDTDQKLGVHCRREIGKEALASVPAMLLGRWAQRQSPMTIEVAEGIPE